MHSNWLNSLKTLCIISFFLLLNARCSLADDIPNEDGEDDSGSRQIQEPEDERLAKRAWQQLQESWSKRNLIDEIKNENFQSAFQNSRNEDYQDGPRNVENEPPRLRDYKPIPITDEFEDRLPVDKRAWKSMSNAWGKRDWSKFNTRDFGWGKREPGNWNNLRGLWGKRSSPQSWNRLSSAWGK